MYTSTPVHLDRQLTCTDALPVQVRANSLAGYNLRGNGAIDRVNNVEQARARHALHAC